MKKQIVFIGLALALLTSPDTFGAKSGKSDVTLQTTTTAHTYKTIDNNGDGDGYELKLHHIAPDLAMKGKAKAAIVFFHGGAWASGSWSSFQAHCDYLASQGMVCFSVEYRLTKKSYDGEKGTVVNCLEDAKSAMRWIRKNAKQFNIDPDRIVASGGSAGGCLAAACSMSPEINDPADDLSISSGAAALVLFNPVINNGPNVGEVAGWGYKTVDNGCKAAGFENYKAFSPYYNITESVPPTIILIGESDNLIPPPTSVAYQAAIEGVGGRCDLYFIANQGHGFFNFIPKDSDTRASGFISTVPYMHDFLREYGFINNNDCQVEEWLKHRNYNNYECYDSFCYDTKESSVESDFASWCKSNDVDKK